MKFKISIPFVLMISLFALSAFAYVEPDNTEMTYKYSFIQSLNIGGIASNLGIDIYNYETVDIIVIILLAVIILSFIIISVMSIYMIHHFKSLPSKNISNNKIELSNIKHYIKANIDQYSYDTIKLTLVEQGHNPDDVDKEYFDLKKDNPDDDYREDDDENKVVYD